MYLLLICSIKEILASLGRKGGVIDLPGETEGEARGVVRALDLKMDWGVCTVNTEETELAAKAFALCNENIFSDYIKINSKQL